MGPEKMMSSGLWIIPMTICLVFMILMMFNRLKGGIRPGMFMQSNRQSNTNSSPESPLDIINKRYARGEISKSEYDNLKRDLSY